MMMLARWLSLGCTALVAGCVAAQAPEPWLGEFCRSAEFREAFLEGQDETVIDEARPSRRLVGDDRRTLPCLKSIAEHGGVVVGIDGCAESSCRTWALWAIRLIGDEDARSFLVAYLASPKEPDVLVTAIQAVGSLREPTARPALLGLLHHEDPSVRLRSIVALGAIKNRDDRAAMLKATKALPENMMASAVHGFRLLAEESAMVALQELAASLKDAAARDSLERELAAWQSAIEERTRILTTLRSGEEWDLIRAIREVHEPVDAEIQEAVVSLLDHEDPHVRAESVVAVGKLHRQSDFERILKITLALPEAYVPIAAQGLELLGDPRAIGPLEGYAANMKNGTRKQAVLGIVERLRRAAGALRDSRDRSDG